MDLFFIIKGERLSHAVGCAFAACLERKQRRDKECGVTMTFDSKTSIFTRSGSFRQPNLAERLQEARDRAAGELHKFLKVICCVGCFINKVIDKLKKKRIV